MGFFSRIFNSYSKSKKLSEITRKVKKGPKNWKMVTYMNI
ncbi:putative transcriptional regulator with HTH domain [Salinibacter ruber]|nr:putative transcriptional regulator with HTH domain [Salinibacter ruber]MCS4101885.1 putative transcriptional regulator with HTH domain [Salinibacter ruber]